MVRMEYFWLYILFAAIVIAVNVMPALMPATWMIISFFVIKYNLPIIFTVILGAMAATAGRVLLANLARKMVRPFLSVNQQKNLTALGRFLVNNKKLSIPLVVSYAFLPIPSNQVFIALGLSGVDFNLIAGSFFAGRLISYAFWVKLADHMADNLSTIITSGWSDPKSIAVEVLGIVGVMVVALIPWARILKVKVNDVE